MKELFEKYIGWLAFAMLVGFIAHTVGSCEDVAKNSSGEIDAVYWHENDRYTVTTIDNDIVTRVKIPMWGHSKPSTIVLYTDVAPDAKSWYDCNWLWNNWTGGSDGRCEIHIHSIDELGTADWNHGKFGTGSTTRID